MQKDMKIGMLAGLLLAAGVMFYVCTRPAFSPKARILGKENLKQQEQIAQEQDEWQEQIEKLITFGPAAASAKQDDQASAAFERGQAPAVPTQVGKRDEDDTRFVQSLPSFEEEIQIEQTESIPEPVIEKQPAPIIEEPPVKQYIIRKFYIVRKNDTLSKISKLYYGNANQWHTIYEANRDVISNPNRIQPGMKLYIPD
ncbi:MAG: LysM peptidoglycan-binding domain-containing protein [Sedimentisphaerales bacterium]|nr:LysM peptidoglycan-binding domain-containing protein [Sedimentisphaerales bacterium]